MEALQKTARAGVDNSVQRVSKAIAFQTRSGESNSGDAAGGRAQRFYCISGQWFFSSREQLQMGPYDSKDVAEGALLSLLRHAGEGGIYPDVWRGSSEP